MDLGAVLATLAQDRPIFHSEADFQHALAWEIHKQNPDARVRLEYRPLPEEPLYLDVWIEEKDGALAVELKYPTRKLVAERDGERFSLKDQAAQDLTPYDFVKDIVRLERVVEAIPHVTGYAVLLTNDSAYWAAPLRANTADAAFRIHDGACLRGTLGWSSNAGSGTMAKREVVHQVRGVYPLAWQEYSSVGGQQRYGRFKYLPVRIDRIDRGDSTGK